MPCFHRVARVNYGRPAVLTSCGQCRGCKHERARQIAVRCVHEAQLHEKNCFITLTFDKKYLNAKGSLVKSDFQLFLKRLRKHFAPIRAAHCELTSINRVKVTKKYIPWDLRYIHCGEYGEQFERPHHHACLFNLDFPDKILLNEKKGFYVSETLKELWPQGLHTISAFNYERAAYVGQYCQKKINGKMAPDHYQGRLPEYGTYSKRPAVGLDWLKKYKDEIYPRDYTVINGRKQKNPIYYDKKMKDPKFEGSNPKLMEELKIIRVVRGENSANNNIDRLKAAEVIQHAKDKQYSNRRYEKSNDS